MTAGSHLQNDEVAARPESTVGELPRRTYLDILLSLGLIRRKLNPRTYARALTAASVRPSVSHMAGSDHPSITARLKTSSACCVHGFT
jgi:hypothetical protein